MKELDDYHRHEALDRSCILAQTVILNLLQHPYIDAHPKLGEKVGKAVELLYEVYNEIGREQVLADLLAWLDRRFPSRASRRP